MATKPKVTGSKACSSVQSVLAVAEMVGCQVDHEEGTAGTNCKQQLTLVAAPGVTVSCKFGPAMRYFARMQPKLGLCGVSETDKLMVDYMMSKIETDIVFVVRALTSAAPIPDAGKQQALESFNQHMTCLNKRLLDNTYVAQERVSIADICLALLIRRVKKSTGKKDLLDQFPNVKRWKCTILGLPALRSQTGGCCGGGGAAAAAPCGSCSKPAAPCGSSCSKPAVAPPCSKSADSSTDDAAAAKKPSAADIEEQIAAEEKARAKKSNPLDALPPSTFVMDAWKREYSNSKDLLGTSMPWFWKNADFEGYSVWYMKYNKMEGENTVGYATSNMLSGFLQRLDNNFRKYSFAVINVMGKEPEFEIEGVWLIRGDAIPNELVEHPSYEYHTFKKLSPTEDKKMIEDFWTADEEIQGRPIQSCKVWK